MQKNIWILLAFSSSIAILLLVMLSVNDSYLHLSATGTNILEAAVFFCSGSIITMLIYYYAPPERNQNLVWIYLGGVSMLLFSGLVILYSMDRISFLMVMCNTSCFLLPFIITRAWGLFINND